MAFKLWRPSIIVALLVSLLVSACAPTAPEADSVGDEDVADPVEEEADGVEQEEGTLQHVLFQHVFFADGLFTDFYFAQAQGYYEAEGLDVEIIEGRGSGSTVDAVANKNVDIGEASSTVAALAVDEGREVVSVGMFAGSSTFGFFIDEELDIDGDSIDALSGKQLITHPGSPEHSILPGIFRLDGVDFATEIEQIVVEPAQQIATYARGEGDFLVSAIPYANPLVQEHRPSTTVPWSELGFVLPGTSFLVHRDTLESDPAMIQGFLRATYRAITEARSNPEQAIDAILEAHEELERDVVASQYAGFAGFYCSEGMQHLGVHATEDWQAALEALQEFADLGGELSSERFFTNQFFDDGADGMAEPCE